MRRCVNEFVGQLRSNEVKSVNVATENKRRLLKPNSLRDYIGITEKVRSLQAGRMLADHSLTRPRGSSTDDFYGGLEGQG